jgi:hypothetical protein
LRAVSDKIKSEANRGSSTVQALFLRANRDSARGFLHVTGCLRFNDNANPGIAPNKNFAIICPADMITYFRIAGISFAEMSLAAAESRRGVRTGQVLR